MKLGGTPVMIPGTTQKKDIGKIIVAIDTSGSISDSIINGFLSELRRIFTTFTGSKTFAVKVILWADKPYADSKDFSAKEFAQLSSWVNENVKWGGTSINPVMELINAKYNKQYVGVVWFTDGQVERLDQPLPDTFHFVVINGFISSLVTDFVADMKRLKPSGKDVTFLRTSYGYNDSNK
jgi:predicted metal-dependent peptidase